MMDTSAYLSIEEGEDDAIECDKAISLTAYPRYVTSLVVAETHRRMLHDYGSHVGNRFLDDLYGSDTVIERPDHVDEQTAIALMRRHGALELTLCDALTAAVMIRLGIGTTFSRDRRDFEPMGFTVIPPYYF